MAPDAGANVPVDGFDGRLTADAAQDAAADAKPKDGSAPHDGQEEEVISNACTDDSPAPRTDDKFICSTCTSNAHWPVACNQGRLQCALPWIGDNGVAYSVPSDQYLISWHDWMSMTGRCAEFLPTTYPGFALVQPGSTTTDFALGDGLVLKAQSSSPRELPSFDWFKVDRSSGEQVIRSLVTITDMTKSALVDYTITDPIMDATWKAQTVTVRPTVPLAANTWYRVTVFPGDSQPQAKCHTFNRTGTAWLTATQTTDIYTSSRPMVAMVDLASNSVPTRKLRFGFSEKLLGTGLSAQPKAQVEVDGKYLSDCLAPYPCSGSTPTEFSAFEIDSREIPFSFTEITLRVAHAMKSVKGGTILDGTSGNPHVKVDGQWAVYTFKAAEMTRPENGSGQVWYHEGI